jgi:ABC-type Mn2+/Zn2+ transport system permease subunit
VDSFWDFFVGPFEPVYMRRALVEVVLLSIASGVLGSWVVLRRLAFLSHALGHATFPALVVAYIAGWSIFGTALATSIVVAIGIGLLSTRPELADGVAVGVVLSAGVAVGAVLVSNVTDPGVGANTILFGSLLALDDADLWRSGVAAALALAVGAGLGRSLLAATFDRPQARSMGLPVNLLDILLLCALAVTVSVAVSIVGSLMLSGLILIPAAAARLVTRRLRSLQVVATGLCMGAGVVGLWGSVRLDAPPGACIALAALLVLALVAAVSSAASTRLTPWVGQRPS